MLPWNLLKSSNNFSSYLSAYSVFLSSIAGVMVRRYHPAYSSQPTYICAYTQISDYWLIRRGHYRVKDLYTTDRDAWYWYTYGINFRYRALRLLLFFTR